MADEVRGQGGSAWGLAVLLGRPLLSFLATMAGAVFFVSALLYFAPGNAADVVANDEALREGLLRARGKSRPWLTRRPALPVPEGTVRQGKPGSARPGVRSLTPVSDAAGAQREAKSEQVRLVCVCARMCV